MSEEITINRNRTLLPSQDYNFLREEGIRHIQQLAGKVWTDYNVHDPGITILELLSYAITDLGQRTANTIADLFAENPQSPADLSDRLHTAASVLSCNALSLQDLRKVLIDIEGIRDAQFVKADTLPPLLEPLYLNFTDSRLDHGYGIPAVRKPIEKLNGFYNVYLEPDETFAENDPAIAEAQRRLHRYRNLCEDFLNIIPVSGIEEITLSGKIDIAPGFDPNHILAEVYFRVEKFLLPHPRFYTLQEMLDKGKRVDQIYEGPLLEHGFLDDEELDKNVKPAAIHVSDLIQIIMDIEGVVGVPVLKVKNDYAGKPQPSVPEEWCLHLSGLPFLQLKLVDPSSPPDLSLYRGLAAIKEPELKITEVVKMIDTLRASEKKAREAILTEDLPVPAGEYQELSIYTPVQNELPRVYGTGPVGLPASATDQRKAQAKQLKAYLLFYEQVLANYLAQLDHAKDMLSWSRSGSDRTYFSQQIGGIKDGSDLYFNGSLDLEQLREGERTYYDRKNALLDHLMARFNEQMTEYTLLLFSMKGINSSTEVVNDKIAFLRDYPEVSGERGKGFDYRAQRLVAPKISAETEPDVWDTENVTGFEKRVSRLVGMDDFSRRFLYAGHYFFIRKKAGFSLWYFELQVRTTDPYIVITGNDNSDHKSARQAFDNLVAEIESLRDTNDIASAFGDNSSGSSYFFEIKDSGGQVLARSQDYTTAAARDSAKQDTITYFKNESYLEHEGFHLLEHTLLYPRTLATDDEVTSTEGFEVSGDSRTIYLPAEPIKIELDLNGNYLLPVTVKDPGLDFYQQLSVDPKEVNLAITENTDTDLSTNPEGITLEIREVIDATTQTLIFNSKDNNYGDFAATEAALKLYAHNVKNYHFELDGSKIIFKIKEPVNQKILGTGVAQITDSGIDYNFDSLSLTREQELEACYRVILKLMAWFSRPITTVQDGETVVLREAIPIDNSCKGDEDPYSFKVTAVLPGWPSKFTNYNMRTHVEKVLRHELPAHIALNYIWISQEQMKDFEICYKNWLLGLAGDRANKQRLKCIVDHLKGLVDVFKAHYEVKPAANEDTYTSGTVLAWVDDPEGTVIFAELINGSILQPWMSLDTSTGTITVNDHLFDSTALEPHWVVPGTYTLYIRTMNDKGEDTSHTVVIKILADFEAAYNIPAAKKLPCYANGDLLAYVTEPSGSDEVVTEADLISGTLPPGTTFYMTTDTVTGVKAGDIKVTNNSLLQPAVYNLTILTTSSKGGRTAHTIALLIQEDKPSQLISESPAHEGQYVNNYLIATLKDPDGNISVVTPSIDLSAIGMGFIAETIDNRQAFTLRVTDSNLFQSKLGSSPWTYNSTTNRYKLSFGLTSSEECSVTRSYTLDVYVIKDTEATVTVAPAKHVGLYALNETLATFNDADGAITSAVRTSDSGPLPAGTSIIKESNNAYIRITDLNAFRTGVGKYTGTASPTPPKAYPLKMDTVDSLNGTTRHEFTIYVIPDRDAVYSAPPVTAPKPSYPRSAYWYKNGDVIYRPVDPDGPIVSAAQFNFQGTFPNFSNPDLLSGWGAALNTSNGDIYVNDESKFRPDRNGNIVAVGNHSLKVITRDDKGGVTLHEITITINPDTASVYQGDILNATIYADEYDPGDLLGWVTDVDQVPNNQFTKVEVISGTLIKGAVLNSTTGEIRVDSGRTTTTNQLNA